MDKLKLASLFCGCGGSDLGLEGGFTFLEKFYNKHPIEVVYANDIEQSACEIYKENFGLIPDVRDIRTVKSEELPNFDILMGGFPCQSFSIVAQNPPRLGYKDDRGKLFFEMCRILKEKQPICFIAENVKGILSANKGEAFSLILKEFSNRGYNVDFKLFNASYFGVPQRRERVFIVGFRSDLNITMKFPNPVLDENSLVPLGLILESAKKIEPKYYFSQKAIDGMKKVQEKMNKGRGQDLSKPCNTVGSHLAKVSLNSTDPVLKIGKKYRRFTPREVSRIQSFPEEFKLIGSESAQYRALGNAIPPVLMWHVANSVIEIIQEHYKEKNTNKSNIVRKKTKTLNKQYFDDKEIACLT